MSEAASAARGGWRSSWRGRAVVAYLAVQLLLPATYYLRRDRHDERFSWRMFSTMRMATCAPEVRVDGRPLQLTSAFHVAWIELARRGRQLVIEAMAAHLCRRNPGSEVVVRLRCSYLDRSTRELGGFDLCKTGEL